MKYYVYTLAHNDTVFYVGKGTGNRVAQHEQEAVSGHHCAKCDLIRSIWQQGGTVQRSIIFETDDEQAALDREAELIQHYGLAQLVNRNQRGARSGLPRRVTRGTWVRDELAAQLVDQLFKTHRHAYTGAFDGKISSLWNSASSLPRGFVCIGYSMVKNSI